MTSTDYEPNIVLETGSYNVVGTRPVRHDAINKVTGRDQFGADIHFAGLLHGQDIAQSLCPRQDQVYRHRQSGGYAGRVKAVVTGDDLPKTDDVALKYRRANILAGDKVLYAGQAVAAVAAVDLQIAEEASERHPGRVRGLATCANGSRSHEEGCPRPSRRPQDRIPRFARRRRKQRSEATPGTSLGT